LPAATGTLMPSTSRTTIVITTYNYARYLGAAVASAAEQTRRSRILIMDDASTDDTEAVVQSALAQHPHIEYCLSQQRRGLSAARNDAARRVDTEWIIYLDADDWLDLRFVERGEEWLDRHPELDVLTTDMTIVRDGSKPFVRKARPPRSWTRLTRKNTIVQTSFIRRSMILALGGYDGTLDYEDWDFWIRALKAGHQIGRLPGPHLYRREHGLNKSKLTDDGLAVGRVRERHPLPSRWTALRQLWHRATRRGD
jgi:glycosyltransferase involved in cell wall biosynthesis